MSQQTSTASRKLKIFAFDPSLGRRLETLGINEVTVSIPFEMDNILEEGEFLGPVGEYLEVIDVDPASGVFYPPIDLNDRRILASDGLAPDESDPRFHQQMVYAVAMTTIAHFERALGRVALWAPRTIRDQNGTFVSEEFVRRLRIYPHALREANAFYSPEKKSLLFGYFEADSLHPDVVPGSTIFTCLSHDVIAHETTHALLDGLHPRYAYATNPDTLALHEAFADIVAIFQHFSYPKVLRNRIAKTRGDLASENLLAQLAQELGHALGRGGALRDALGGYGKDNVWRRHRSNRSSIHTARGPHARGAILVAAVFEAFLNIYKMRTADLFRIATNGSGELPPGAIHPDLVDRLADTAAKSARHILEICIRALDYCPPVDLTIGDYLRAIITADHDLFPEDDRHYRVAILEAFIGWGLVPEGMRTYSTRSLLWPTLDELVADQDVASLMEDLESKFGVLISDPSRIRKTLRSRSDVSTNINDALDRNASRISDLMNTEMEDRIVRFRHKDFKVKGLVEFRSEFELDQQKKYDQESVLSQNLLETGLAANREITWYAQSFYCLLFWGLLTDPRHGELLKLLGLCNDNDAPHTVFRSGTTGKPAIEVHSVRMANRRGVRGQTEREYVVEVTQRRRGYLDPNAQREKDHGNPLPDDEPVDFWFRRGCTLLIDARTFRIRRVIRTTGDVSDDTELEHLRSYLAERSGRPRNAFHSGNGAALVRDEAFARLHRRVEED